MKNKFNLLVLYKFLIILELLFVSYSEQITNQNTNNKFNKKRHINSKVKCFWGSFRPGPYFGLRAKEKNSPLFGIMWYYPDQMWSVKNARHFNEVSDEISKYEWQTHNGCNYGELLINDTIMKVEFKVEFFTELINNNSDYHWVVKISGKTMTDLKKKGVVFIWYLSNSNENNIVTKEDNHQSSNKLYNFTKGLFYDSKSSIVKGVYSRKSDNIDNLEKIEKNKHTFYVKSTQSDSNTHPIYNGVAYNKPFFIVFDIQDSRIYDPLEYIITQLKDPVGNMPNHLLDFNDSYFSESIKQGNVYVEQIFLIEEFTFNISFFETNIINEELDKVVIQSKLDIKRNEFLNKFNQVFNTKSSHNKNIKFLTDVLNNEKLSFDSKQYDQEKTAISALSGLFSNTIYMFGRLQVLNSNTNSYDLSEEYELLTIAPDKTSHGRGFMWDEGFQQRLLSLWDLETSLQVLQNWFSNVDNLTGWLAREQSIDEESRSRALPSSWASIPGVSNPPALIFLISQLIERSEEQGNTSDLNSIKEFIFKSINNIEKNARWYVTSQRSSKSEHEFLFSWKGKTDEFCLPSGLDDYPRCQLQSNNYAEGHIDLQSWIITLANSMVKIFSLINEKYEFNYNKNIEYWNNVETQSFNVLINMFWDKTTNQFSDFYFEENSKTKDDSSIVYCSHTGYLTLFPLILNNFKGKENDSNYKVYINSMLEKITNEQYGLRTNYGIRSLSIHDEYYNKNTRYWTSPIWVNINYLIIKQLNELRKLDNYTYLNKEYSILREQFVDNLVKVFNETGYIWEVYDDIDGHGKYNRPFTGWSALIVNLIYEKY